jgi:hypothetical protein
MLPNLKWGRVIVNEFRAAGLTATTKGVVAARAMSGWQLLQGSNSFRPLSNARPGIMQMIDVHLPTTDGRELVITRYTEPEPDLSLLLEKLKLELPAQPPPKSPPGPFRRSRCSADLRGSVYAISNT